MTDPALDTREVYRISALDDLIVLRRPGWIQAFVRRSWELIGDRELDWNWHHSLLCAELERIADGRTREEYFGLPPGTMKSAILSSMFPAAIWLHRPAFQFICITAVEANASRDSRRHREIVLSPWYRGLVDRIARTQGIGLVTDREGNRVLWTLSPDESGKMTFENTARGHRRSYTTGADVIGTRAGGLIADDIIDPEKTMGAPASVMAYLSDIMENKYDGTWNSRLDPIECWRIMSHQALCGGDPGDVLMKRGVRRVVLPMEFDPDFEHRHPRDPRKGPGELLQASRMPAARLADLKRNPVLFDAFYNQKRRTLGGVLFPREYFATPAKPGGAQRYKGRPEIVAKGLDGIGISVDCTFGKGTGRDRVALEAWGWRAANRYILDVVAARMDIGETITAILNMRAKVNAWAPGKLRWVLIEKAANGEAVKDLIGPRVPNLILHPVPLKGKYARAQVSAYAYQAGNIWLPEPEVCPLWLPDWIERHVAFTGEEGGEDDEIDAESQAMIFLNDDDAKVPANHLQQTRDLLAAVRGV